MSTTPLSKALHERGTNNVKRLRAQLAFQGTPRVKALMETIDWLIERHSMEVYTDVGTYSTSIYLTVKGLTGLKDPSLAALLDTLVHAESDHTATSDSPASFSRSYQFYWYGDAEEHSGFQSALYVNVTASFKEDSETCKRVIVGYKEPSTEAQPIYELRCTDDAPTEQE
jgi:hypothetical protein